MSATHTLVVTETEDHHPDHQPDYQWRVECSDPSDCPGWEECREDHTGFDPNSPESPAYDQDEVVIHGVPHQWRYGYGWTTSYAGCPVQAFADDAGYDIAYEKGAGTWPIDVDWNDDECYFVLIEEASA